MQRLLAEIARTPGCSVAPPRGSPQLRLGDRLPDDLAEFYRCAGGLRLYDMADYPIHIVGPAAFVCANPELVGADHPEDISDTWYVLARTGESEAAITIDCDPARAGRCQDGFWDRHAVAGSCPIVALSFSELLRRLLEGRGSRWYWLDGDPGYGDAYDG